MLGLSAVVKYWSQLIEAIPLSAQRRQDSATSSCHFALAGPTCTHDRPVA